MPVVLDHAHDAAVARLWVFGVVGVALIASGVWLYVTRRGRPGDTRVQFGPIKLSTTHSSLALVVIGAGLLVTGMATQADSQSDPDPKPEPPDPDPGAQVIALNRDGVEAMRRGNYGRARRFFQQVLKTEGIEGHSYEGIAQNNLGHVAVRVGDLEQAREWLARGDGPELRRIVTLAEKCNDEHAPSCFELAEYYRDIYRKNPTNYRAMGQLALEHHTRACDLRHPPSCQERLALSHLE